MQAAIIMARKRLNLEEFVNLESVASPTKAAKVHGVVTNISPMKSAAVGKSSYFYGQLSDETSSMRVVGFDQLQQRKLAEHHEKKQAITLENCEIKKSRYGEDMEVMIKQNTAVLT